MLAKAMERLFPPAETVYTKTPLARLIKDLSEAGKSRLALAIQPLDRIPLIWVRYVPRSAMARTIVALQGTGLLAVRCVSCGWTGNASECRLADEAEWPPPLGVCPTCNDPAYLLADAETVEEQEGK